MSFSVTDRQGRMLADPDGPVIDEILAELDDEQDAEHPDVALSHESGWCLSAFPSGLVTWENVEDDSVEPRHRRGVSRAEVRELWMALASGRVADIEERGWRPGYG